MKRVRTVRRFALVVVFGLLTFVVISAFFAYRFTSPPRRTLETAPEKFLTAFENVRFPARDGTTLSGWFVPCTNAKDTKQAVVLLHGDGSTRTQMLARAKFFSVHGYAALLYAARAHGLSDGHLASFGHFETRDLLGAIDWLRTRGFTSFGCLGASQGAPPSHSPMPTSATSAGPSSKVFTPTSPTPSTAASAAPSAFLAGLPAA